jgi:hypothetical protein
MVSLHNGSPTVSAHGTSAVETQNLNDLRTQLRGCLVKDG